MLRANARKLAEENTKKNLCDLETGKKVFGYKRY
jgi:hypothetical protein